MLRNMPYECPENQTEEELVEGLKLIATLAYSTQPEVGVAAKILGAGPVSRSATARRIFFGITLYSHFPEDCACTNTDLGMAIAVCRP